MIRNKVTVPINVLKAVILKGDNGLGDTIFPNANEVPQNKNAPIAAK